MIAVCFCDRDRLTTMIAAALRSTRDTPTTLVLMNILTSNQSYCDSASFLCPVECVLSKYLFWNGFWKATKKRDFWRKIRHFFIFSGGVTSSTREEPQFWHSGIGKSRFCLGADLVASPLGPNLVRTSIPAPSCQNHFSTTKDSR